MADQSRGFINSWQWLKTRSRLPAAGLLLCLFWLASVTTASAIQPVPDSRGQATLAQALQRLPVVASLLHTGAHPDDENSALLAYVSQGLHVRTAYMALNRGEGGQNLIGPERYDGIGIIRTEELLAARRFDGGEQFFTRAFDFGFSKSMDEALELWGHERLLGDVVRVIRRFRPDVIVSVFAGAREDGHGQHQVAGLLTREAFRTAADPSRFPEQIAQGLQPWQAEKLYINNMRASFPSLDSLTIDTGDYSPVFHRSYLEMGLAGRSMHRSQDMGTIQRKGPATTTIKLVDRIMAESGNTPDRTLFDGIDTSFMRLTAIAGADRIPSLKGDLTALDTAARSAVDAYRPFDPAGVLPATLEGLNILRRVRSAIASSNMNASDKDYTLFLLDKKERDFTDVVSLALGLSFDVLADSRVIIPGSPFNIGMQLLNRSRITITPTVLRLSAPEGWSVASKKSDLRPIGYNEQAEETVAVEVAQNARLSKPYWRREGMNGSRVMVESEQLIGLPWRPEDLIGHAVFTVNGTSVEITQPVQFRYADQAFGEIRRQVLVAPALSVALTPENAVIPVSGMQNARPFQVVLRNNVHGKATGAVRLALPDGWTSSPPAMSFEFTREDQETSFTFEVTPSQRAGAGGYRVEALAEMDGKVFREGYKEIAYPHIEPRHLYRDAVSDVKIFDVQVAGDLKVGYIMGVGDDIPLALEQLGIRVAILSPEDLASGDLSRYDVIVAGIRAYEVRRDLAAQNHRLLEYVNNGGTFIVQYNQYVFNEGQFGPYPAQIRRPHDRVTREEAPVTILKPEHPLFNMPNRIKESDFEGWVQERGLYFWGEWDGRYTPLMSSHDPGEEPKDGGMLEARYGKGRYVYTGYAWFRQLPAGVPGAFRIFANLLSLPKTELAP